MSPSETARELSRALTCAIWNEALAIKDHRAITAAACATNREAIAARLRFIADRWNSDERRDSCLENDK